MNNRQKLDKIFKRIQKQDLEIIRDFALREMRSSKVENVTAAWTKAVLLKMLIMGFIKEDLWKY